jgi:protein-disulfide isomerase-like protein with CxxC motif
MPRIDVTHISDPGCPFAYSAQPFLTALQWRYGAQLAWRHVLIGLTEERRQYAERGYTPLLMAQGNRSFARFGMPFGRQPKSAVAATARACRLVVATRLVAPELEWPVFRALQFTQFTTPLELDGDEALRDALGRVRGIGANLADELLFRLDGPDVTTAYEADRREARTAAGSPTEFQGKSADTDGAVRYTAPSLVFTTGDGRSLEAGGFQPLEAYDVLIANLDPTLERRGAPADPARILEAFDHPLTTREVATILAEGAGAPDDTAAELALMELADRGQVRAEPLGDGTLWVADGARFSRSPQASPARAATG